MNLQQVRQSLHYDIRKLHIIFHKQGIKYFLNQTKHSTMKEQFILQKNYVLFFMVLFATFGCNNGVDKNSTSGTLATCSINAAEVSDSVTESRTFGGKLDTLWIAAADFKKLDKDKAIFIFHFNNGDVITLDGWKEKGGTDSFNIPPDVQFSKGNKDTTLKYGPGTYFGNIGLSKIKKIQKMITDSSATHVIFAPAKLGEHVYYKIYLSKEPHMVLRKTFALIPTEESTNPSPPKQYNP